MVYLVRGRNGVIIKENWTGAKRCMNYIYKSYVEKFETVTDASIAALQHLEDITPPDVLLPPTVEMNEMITVNKLKKESGMLQEV